MAITDIFRKRSQTIPSAIAFWLTISFPIWAAQRRLIVSGRAMKSVKMFFSAILLLLLFSAPSWAAIGVPSVNPPIIPAGQATDVVISVSIPDATLLPTSVNLLRVGSTGATTIIASLNDQGLNGDAKAGDRIFTATVNFNESTGTTILLRFSAALKGTLKRITKDFQIPVIAIPTILDYGQYNQTINGIFTNLVNAQNNFLAAKDPNISPSQFFAYLANTRDKLTSVYASLYAIYRFETHSPSNYPAAAEYAPILGSLIGKANDAITERQKFIANGLDPDVSQIASWCLSQGILDQSELSGPDISGDRQLCAALYTTDNPNSSYNTGVLKEAQHVCITQIAGQATDLIGSGIGGLFQDLGTIASQTVEWSVDAMFDVFTSSVTGDKGMMVAQVSNGQSLQVPTGSHDIIESSTLDNTRAIARNVWVSTNDTTSISLGAGEVKDYSGLVAHYPFDGNANDTSGNGNNGTVYDAFFVGGKFGSGIEVSGNYSSYVEVPHSDSLSPSQAVTISLWAKALSPSPAYSSLIYKAGAPPTTCCGDRVYSLWLRSDGGIHFASTPEGASNQVYCDSPGGLFGLNNFGHVAGVINTADHTMKIYVNGEQVQVCTNYGDKIRGGSYPLRIGGHFHTLGDQYNFDGVIDEVRIYNRALSQEEIWTLAGLSVTSTKLFDAVPVTGSGAQTDPSLAVSFARKNVTLTCNKTPVTATISSTPDGTGAFVVDNFLAINGSNVCTAGPVECGGLGTCAARCFLSAAPILGGDALATYQPVPPLDVSAKLGTGQQIVTFDLMDWGEVLASSDIWLVTNCTVVP